MNRCLPLPFGHSPLLGWLALLSALLTTGGLGASPILPLPAANDFGFLWWADGPPYFHQQPVGYDTKPAGRLLCFRTGRYGLVVDTLQLKLPHFGRLSGSTRDEVFRESNERLLNLPPAEFELSIRVGETDFRCTALPTPKDPFFYPIRFVEYGNVLQRVDFDGLIFRDAQGNPLNADAHLEIAAWPDRVSFLVEVTPRETFAAASLRFHLQTRGLTTATDRSGAPGGDWPAGAIRRAWVAAAVPPKRARPRATQPSFPLPRVTALTTSNAPVVTYVPEFDAFEVNLQNQPWSNAKGTYYPEEHLDRLDRWRVELANDSDVERVVRLRFCETNYLPITGFTPLWLDADGFPTGIPIQVSKNWHINPEKGALRHQGPWFHGSTIVRLPPHQTNTLQFAMTYARWGGVFAASQAQLSLIGWGHNQFWDQNAIGSFGESICFEPGRVQRRCFITDVRPLLVAVGKSGKPWEWTSNVGGGDYLVLFDATNRFVPFAGTRGDYVAPGPNLTRTRYHEVFADGAIAAEMIVSLPRVDDHVRVFQHLRYQVKRPVNFSRLAFFQLGADYYDSNTFDRLAIGNADGLIEEWSPGQGSWRYEWQDVLLQGPAAWVSAHAEHGDPAKGDGGATRGWIVRSWKARLGGRDCPAPRLAVFLTEWGKGNYRTALELAPPADLRRLEPGDFVEADIELVVHPSVAGTYYGPNAGFRDALARDANTWRLTHREAAGNALAAQATRGRVLGCQPLVIAVDRSQRAEVSVTGGLGYVPITFTGLEHHRGYALEQFSAGGWQPVDQSVHGHDFWQVGFDAEIRKFRLTFNLPLDQPNAAVPHRFRLRPDPGQDPL